jgi:DNA integrity scanning protein DisA with diadenylate cyclase activity
MFKLFKKSDEQSAEAERYQEELKLTINQFENLIVKKNQKISELEAEKEKLKKEKEELELRIKDGVKLFKEALEEINGIMQQVAENDELLEFLKHHLV